MSINTEGITNPPIDDLLAAVDSKYRLVIIAAKRTAVCPRGGAFARLSIEDLGAPVLSLRPLDALQTHPQ